MRMGGMRTQFRLGALAVNAHLALAEHSVNAAFRHVAPLPHQEIVDALAVVAFACYQDRDFGSHRFRHD
jgi:hypothetical protein